MLAILTLVYLAVVPLSAYRYNKQLAATAAPDRAS